MSHLVTSLSVKHLLHPKAGGGAVEQAEQGEMIVLGGIAGQLDNRCRLLEDLPAAVEHEVVVRGDLGKDDREGVRTLIRMNCIYSNHGQSMLSTVFPPNMFLFTQRRAQVPE